MFTNSKYNEIDRLIYYLENGQLDAINKYLHKADIRALRNVTAFVKVNQSYFGRGGNDLVEYINNTTIPNIEYKHKSRSSIVSCIVAALTIVTTIVLNFL